MEVSVAGHVPAGCCLLDTRQGDGNRRVRPMSTDRRRCRSTDTTAQVFTALLRPYTLM